MKLRLANPAKYVCQKLGFSDKLCLKQKLYSKNPGNTESNI